MSTPRIIAYTQTLDEIIAAMRRNKQCPACGDQHDIQACPEIKKVMGRPVMCANGDGRRADVWEGETPLCGRCYLVVLGVQG